MKFMIQLFATLVLLTATLAGAFHPDFGVLWHNPLALFGMGLIGLGLIRNVQTAAASCREG
ncbi:MAG: hypothetical protein AAF911_02990 [Planctomycetota bacterium]